jgi:hypothetical protein
MMNSPNFIFSRIYRYLRHRYVIKYVDNFYWKLRDIPFSSRIELLYKEDHEDQLKKYFSGTDMDFEKRTNIKYYNLIIHILSSYVYKIHGAMVDPEYNWAILNRRQVFKYSFPMAEDPWDYMKARPSLFGYLFRRKPLMLEKAILVKYSWSNYYHFFVDTLPQIMLCDKLGVPKDVPIIVPYNFPQIAFVQEYFGKVNSPDRKIIIQEKNQYIQVKELYVAKDTFFSTSVAELHKTIPYLPYVEQQNADSPSRVFVTRTKKHKRNIRNGAEIEAIIREHGFTIVDAAEYTVAQQIKLFSNAQYIVGIHGAAMTNMLFSKCPKVSVMEIFPGKRFNPGHYSNLSAALGFEYRSIRGQELDENMEFHLDADVFKTNIKEMLGS